MSACVCPHPNAQVPLSHAPPMRAFEWAGLLAARERDGRLYHEFLREPTLSAGLYRLPAGSTDPQRPHSEDEVYLVLRGRGRFRGGAEEVAVGPGSVIFVPAREEHRFFDVAEDLEILVLFAPPEHANRA